METTTQSTPKAPTKARRSKGTLAFLKQHWLLIFSLVYGALVITPFLAPVFMRIGWEGPARGIYFFYSFLCHQMAQRSFFLFGPQSMYNLNELQAGWQIPSDPLALRQFIGNSEMGWKVAWSDRMVSMYGSVLIFAWIWGLFRRRLKPLPWWGLILLALPMAIDGTTHLISDFAGISEGFRYSNAWLAELTNFAFPATFYAGDALGSFNSWMRLLTGILFGMGVVWFGFPYLAQSFDDISL